MAKRYDLTLRNARIADREMLLVAALVASRAVSRQPDDELTDMVIEYAERFHDAGGEVTTGILIRISELCLAKLRLSRDRLSPQYDYRPETLFSLVSATIFGSVDTRLDGRLLSDLEMAEIRADLSETLPLLSREDREIIAKHLKLDRRPLKGDRRRLNKAMTRLASLLNSYHGRWVRSGRTITNERRETAKWAVEVGNDRVVAALSAAENPGRKLG